MTAASGLGPTARPARQPRGDAVMRTRRRRVPGYRPLMGLVGADFVRTRRGSFVRRAAKYLLFASSSAERVRLMIPSLYQLSYSGEGDGESSGMGRPHGRQRLVALRTSRTWESVRCPAASHRSAARTGNHRGGSPRLQAMSLGTWHAREHRNDAKASVRRSRTAQMHGYEQSARRCFTDAGARRAPNARRRTLAARPGRARRQRRTRARSFANGGVACCLIHTAVATLTDVSTDATARPRPALVLAYGAEHVPRIRRALTVRSSFRCAFSMRGMSGKGHSRSCKLPP
jgi:hypothetical protein